MIDIDCECADLPLRGYAAGEWIIEEGGHSGALFFLRRGTVEVIREEVLLANIARPGTVFGEISILLGRPHLTGVRALEDCEFHVAVDAEDYLRGHSEVGLCIARDLAWKVDAMSSYLTDLKRQYGDHGNHLSMVHEVLESLVGESRKSG